jgi:hypothetical protein
LQGSMAFSFEGPRMKSFVLEKIRRVERDGRFAEHDIKFI